MSLCECGCGQTTSGRIVRGVPIRFIRGHHGRVGPHVPQRIAGGGYVVVYCPGHPRQDKSGHVLEHVLVAERALGHALPTGAEVHHVNGCPTDNRPSNLVICPDHAYHMVIHRRARALAACGHAGWYRCRYCRRWDDPRSLSVAARPSHSYHPICATADSLIRRGRPLSGLGSRSRRKAPAKRADAANDARALAEIRQYRDNMLGNRKGAR